MRTTEQEPGARKRNLKMLKPNQTSGPTNSSLAERGKTERTMTKNELLAALRNVDGLPELRSKKPNHRTIYEAGKGSNLAPSGHFYVDYATFPSGTTEEVPLYLIRELETEGLIRRESPSFKSWILTEAGAVTR
jgi:hypothetical protein